MTVNHMELSESVTALFNVEYIGRDKFMIVWSDSVDLQARKLLKDMKIKSSREQKCNAGDWRFNNPMLNKIDTYFWVVTSRSVDKIMASGNAVMNLLLD